MKKSTLLFLLSILYAMVCNAQNITTATRSQDSQSALDHLDTTRLEGWKKYYALAENARTAMKFETAAGYFQQAADLKGKYKAELLFDVAIMYTRANKLDEAFKAMEATVDAGFTDIPRAAKHSRLGPLRADSRWKTVLRKMAETRPLEYFQWQTGSLRSAQIPEDAVKDLTAKIEAGDLHDVHSFLIAKDGKLVYERYFNSGNLQEHHEIRSAQKSITALLVGIAIDKGFIKNIHDPVLNYFPAYKPSKNWDERKKKMTVFHFLTMTSGLGGRYTDEDVLQNQQVNKDWVTYMLDAPMKYNPGDSCEYSSSAVNVLNGVIENASGMLLEEFADRYLFGPLEIYNKSLRFDPAGRVYAAGGAEFTSRDMLKFGQLLVDGGKWNGKRIISLGFLKELETKHFEVYYEKIDYGYLWHLVQARTRSGKMVTSYGAYGNGGQFILAIPKLKMVCVFTAGNFGQPYMGDTINYFHEKILTQMP